MKNKCIKSANLNGIILRIVFHPQTSTHVYADIQKTKVVRYIMLLKSPNNDDFCKN